MAPGTLMAGFRACFVGEPYSRLPVRDPGGHPPAPAQRQLPELKGSFETGPSATAMGRVQHMARRAGGSAVYHLPAVGPRRPLNGRNGRVTGASPAAPGGRDPARSGRWCRGPRWLVHSGCGR
jgi:hypothetical protein